MLIRHRISQFTLILAVAALVGVSTSFFWSRAQAAALTAAAPGSAGAALWSGQIVVQNDGSAAATVVINFYSTVGVLVKSYSLPGPIPAKGSTVVDTEAIGDLPNGFAGSAVVSANQPVTAAFIGRDVTNASINSTMYNGISTGADSVYVPQISHNYSDQTSTLAVQNIDSVTATVTISFFERFTGARTALITDSIPPNASHFYDASQLPGNQTLPPPWTGAALIQSTGGRVAAAVQQPYMSSTKAVSFEGAIGVGTDIFLPSALYQYASQRQTTFIDVQNATPNPVTATITFYSTNGAAVGSASGTIQGYQKQSWNPGSAGIPPQFNGTAVVRASGAVVAMANIISATDLSLAYTGGGRGTARQALPFIRWSPSSDPKGWRTFVAAMNTDSLPADITIKYYDTDGHVTNIATFQGVPANAKVNHNPGVFIGDATYLGSVEIESTRTVLGLVNAITVDETKAESYTSGSFQQ